MKLYRTIILCLLVALLVIGCATTVQHSESNPENGVYENEDYDNGIINDESAITTQPLQKRELPINEDGLFEVIMPENLLGGRTAERTAREFPNTLINTPEILTVMSDVFANDDGTATMLHTEEQLLQLKHNMRYFAHFNERADVIAIKEVIFIDEEMLTEMVVLVDVDVFVGRLLERTMAGPMLATNAGTYQVLNGVAPDEWRTTITIKDVNTGEIISRTDFPHDDMFRIEY
jgi:uncharacterized protein YceK